MDKTKPNTHQACVIGYGNPFRTDDGIGAFVAERLKAVLGHGTRILTFHQLDPVVIDEVQDSDLVVFVDASEQRLRGGIQWGRLRPERPDFAYTTHHFKPSWLLNFLSSFNHRVPETWMVSIQGDDFGHGEGLSKGARARAVKACREIAEFISAKTD